MTTRPIDNTSAALYPNISNAAALDIARALTALNAVRNSGFSSGAALPAAVFNELGNEISHWIQWFDSLLPISQGYFNVEFDANGSKIFPFYYQIFSGITLNSILTTKIKVWWNDITGLGSNHTHGGNYDALPTGIQPSANRFCPVVTSANVLALAGFYNNNGSGQHALTFFSLDGSTVFTSINSGVIEYLL